MQITGHMSTWCVNVWWLTVDWCIYVELGQNEDLMNVFLS